LQKGFYKGFFILIAEEGKGVNMATAQVFVSSSRCFKLFIPRMLAGAHIPNKIIFRGGGGGCSRTDFLMFVFDNFLGCSKGLPLPRPSSLQLGIEISGLPLKFVSALMYTNAKK
jgi:hypothetical protein